MSSNSNDEAGGLAILGGIFWAFGLFVFALMAFAALIGTLLCFLAWKEPLEIGSLTITPDEAHRFVGGGIIWALLVPAFVAFSEWLFNFQIEQYLWFYLFVGGYSFGSVFLALDRAEAKEKEAAYYPPLPMSPPVSAPIQSWHKAQPHLQPRPFQFASWHDEEIQR